VIPKHFVPPLLANAVLGAVLWTSYAETFSLLSNYLDTIPAAMLAGGAAGGMQALVAPPIENIRLAIEGGSGGWTHAWKEVFRDTAAPRRLTTKAEELSHARRVRDWMREVGDMAGRGWKGWGWTLAKDVSGESNRAFLLPISFYLGFSVFFAVFEGTRCVAARTTLMCQNVVDSTGSDARYKSWLHRNASRLVHAGTLVSGGVLAGLAYEIVCRPWDAARKFVYLDRVNGAVTRSSHHYLASVLSKHIRQEGILSLFKAPYQPEYDTSNITSARRRRLYAALRRLGPWGFGFLAWEAFGSGLGHKVDLE
jgi:hypothetical protein